MYFRVRPNVPMFHRILEWPHAWRISLDEKSVSMIQVGGRRFSSNYEPGNRSFVRHTSVSQSSVPRVFDEYLAKLALNKAKRSVTTNVTSGGNELLIFKKKLIDIITSENCSRIDSVP